MPSPAHPVAAAAFLAQPPARRYEMARFGLAQWPQALQLLLSQYPQTRAAWWEAGIQRLREVPPNDENLPLGLMMHGPQGLAGVMLLIASRRDGELDDWLRISGSSWAMEPQARGQVLRMAQACLQPRSITTALTPTPAALRVEQRVGFVAISHQRVLAATPRLAWRRTPTRPQARVVDAGRTLAAFRGRRLGQALADHHALGCVVCAIETTDRLWPLVLNPRRQSRVLPLAELIYTGSVEAVAAAIAPLSRHLLGLGYLLLEFEAHEDAVFDFPCTRLFRRRFAYGPYDTAGIDHLYSELVYLHRGG